MSSSLLRTAPDEETEMNTKANLQVLIVEDEYLVAREICDMVEKLGHKVVGPAPSVDRARQLLDVDSPDVALVDINLGGSMVYSLVDDLDREEVPLVFVTGYDNWSIEEDFRSRHRLEKPLRSEALKKALSEVRLT
jgi:two-component SAPR family response regulator